MHTVTISLTVVMRLLFLQRLSEQHLKHGAAAEAAALVVVV
jgi:hypothetical protein